MPSSPRLKPRRCRLGRAALGCRLRNAAEESQAAVCARDADKLECVIQGIEYKAQGYENAQRWIDNSRGRLTTKSANELADAVLAGGTLDWLRAALGERQG